MVSAVGAPDGAAGLLLSQHLVGLRLESRLGKAKFGSWFQRVRILHEDDTTVRLSAPTRHSQSYIRQHLELDVLACWRADRPGIERIEIEVRSDGTSALPQSTTGRRRPPLAAGERLTISNNVPDKHGDQR